MRELIDFMNGPASTKWLLLVVVVMLVIHQRQMLTANRLTNTRFEILEKRCRKQS